MRVHELAKELGIKSAEALEHLQALGVEVTSNFNTVSKDDAARLRDALADGGAAVAGAEKKEPAAKKAKKKTARKAPAKQATAAKKAPAKQAAARVAEKKKEKRPEQAVATAVKREAKKQAAAEPAPAERRPEPVAEAKRPAEPPVARAPVTIEDGITVKELAERASMKPADVIRELMERGTMANINQALDIDVAMAVAGALGIEARPVRADEALLAEAAEDVKVEDLELRPPVVTIMGHVDHGKTLLLDAVRQTNVVDREAGGITQHIGASTVVHNGNRITFIDTPGHEAFTRMRARGAQVTDIVVLVVAADDGVMPQTREAIDHARAAEVPIVVAINKIDRPDANVDRVKQQLADHDLTPEDWGGKTVTVAVSAKLKQNLDDLLEMIVLTAEILELKASPKALARGTVLEAELDRRRGAVATLLVQEGTLRVGDSLVVGVESGKVRAMIDDKGDSIAEVGPSTAVEVLGLSGVPAAGDRFQVVEEKTVARKVSDIRQERQREKSLAAGSRLTLEDLHEQLRAGETQELPIVVKADVQGSVEVLRDALEKLSTDKVKVKIVHGGAGGITESDVLLASASNAVIVGFNVRPERGVAEIAQREGVDLRLYSVIYQLLDDIQQAMLGQLEPEYEETTQGRAEVRDTFRIPRVGTIAGCYVTDGKITRDSKVRLVRDSKVVFEGRVGSLKRFQDDVREVQHGYECGVGIANFNDVKIGDVIEAYQVEEVERTL